MNGMTAQRQATSIKLLEGAVVRHHSFLLLAACPGKAEDDVFIRIDRDDSNAWKEELANVRFLVERRSEYGLYSIRRDGTPGYVQRYAAEYE